MKNNLVYDGPTRLFHWVFAGLTVTAFVIAKTIDDESPTFAYHMMAGMTAGVAILLRIIWGLVGSRHARFSSWPLAPGKLIEYMKDMFRSKGRIWTGHNPASSWAALIMMGAVAGLIGSGLMMSQNKEFWEEIHEFFVAILVVSVVAHLLGVVFHTIRHKDPIGLSMITGAKKNADPNEVIGSSHGFSAGVMAVILGFFVVQLARGYDPQNGQLSLLGMTLQLGENEDQEGKGGENESGESKGGGPSGAKDDDHDDQDGDDD